MEKSFEGRSMRNEISIVAGPREWGDTRESWLARVSRKVPTVPFRTVKGLWYGEIRSPDHWAAREIRRAAELIEARKEASALASQYQSIIGGLRATDEDFHRTQIDRLERIVSQLSNVDRA